MKNNYNCSSSIIISDSVPAHYNGRIGIGAIARKLSSKVEQSMDSKNPREWQRREICPKEEEVDSEN